MIGSAIPRGPAVRALSVGVWLLAALWAGSGAAREPARIAELSVSWGPTASGVGLRDGLVALGYREDRDFFIGVRFTRGDLEALIPAARDLVQYGVDLVFASGDNAALAALGATSGVPIVCLCNAVEIGAAQSLARPGGHLTGVTDLHLELGGKRLQLFQELVPGLRRVLFPYHPADRNAANAVKRYRAGAAQLGLELIEMPIAAAPELERLSAVSREHVDGILAPVFPILDIPGVVLKLASERGIPTLFPGGTFWVERGALISYGPDFADSGRLAARLVDKILRGGNPAEIPIERNPNIHLFLNAGTAGALGLRIPPSLLRRADEVFE